MQTYVWVQGYNLAHCETRILDLISIREGTFPFHPIKAIKTK